MPSCIRKNLHIVSPADSIDFTGDIRIADGKFAAVGPCLSPEPGDAVHDLSGLTAFPGLLDMHVHLRDPGFLHKEDIFTGCEAAAAAFPPEPLPDRIEEVGVCELQKGIVITPGS